MQFAASSFSALLAVEVSVETEVSSARSLSACDKHSDQRCVNTHVLVYVCEPNLSRYGHAYVRL